MKAIRHQTVALITLLLAVSPIHAAATIQTNPTSLDQTSLDKTNSDQTVPMVSEISSKEWTYGTARNDRGIETNRDYSNIVQMGFTEGLLKVVKGGKLDCVDEGLSIFRALVGFLWRIATHEHVTSMDGMNIFEILLDFIPRCNYLASLEGLVVSHYVSNLLMHQN